MILADTSIWIDHLRRGEPRLAALRNAGQVVTHAFVIGEIALGQLRQRVSVLAALDTLPFLALVDDAELLRFIDMEDLAGTGLGLVDVHLLAAASRVAATAIWSLDKRLVALVARLDIAMQDAREAD